MSTKAKQKTTFNWYVRRPLKKLVEERAQEAYGISPGELLARLARREIRSGKERPAATPDAVQPLAEEV